MRRTWTGKYLIGIALLALVLGLVAIACGDDDEDVAAPAPVEPADTAVASEVMEEEPEETEAMAEPTAVMEEEEMAVTVADRGTVRLAHWYVWGGLGNWDASSPTYFSPGMELVQDKIVRLDDSGLPTPMLAASWETNADATRWTFNLQEGVTFQDGTPMTSQDVIYSLEHAMDPNLGGQMLDTLSFIDSERFETPDDLTAVFNLTDAHVDVPLLLRHYSMRVIPDGSGDRIAQSAEGTGAFILDHFAIDGVTSLHANDDYWQGMPLAGQYTIVGIADADARVQAALADQIDMVRGGLTPAQAQLYEGNSDFVIQENPMGSVQVLAIIVTEPPYDDIRVRQAMKMVVDPEEMVAVVMQGHAVQACNNPVWPNDQYYLPQECPQDIDGAKALLAEAGYPDGLTIEYRFSGKSATWEPVATVYQQQAALAGITVELDQAPADTWWTDSWMVHPFASSNWGNRPADQILSSAFLCGAPWGENFWCNDEFDQTLAAARAEVDFDTRKALYQHAQALQVEQGGMIAPLFQNQIRVLASNIEGLNPATINWEFPWYQIHPVEQ